MGMKAVPQTPQGPRALTCVFYEQGGMFARRAPGALLLDYVPPEEPPSTPLGNALRIRCPKLPQLKKVANWGTQYHSRSFKGDLGQHLSKLGEWGVRIAQPHRSPVEATGVIEVSRTVELHHNIGPTSVGVKTFSTIVLLTLITNCDGGAFWQHNTHTSASSSASSCVPQPSKQLLNACPIPPVHVIATLLVGCQSAILSSNEWHNDMNPALISTIMAPNFEIKEITSGTRRSIPIPNQNIC